MKTTPNIKNQEIKKIEPNQGSDNLRQDWIECTFADVIEIISGKNQKKVVNPNGKYPIYGSGGIIGKANEYLCEAGTTIIGRKGTINSPIYVTEKFWNVDTAFGFHPYSILNNKLLYYFCLHFNFKKLDKSTTIPSLAKRDLLQIPFVLPPIPIQKAIVKKIEELFSSLDSGIADLKKAQDQLVIYRQAVLKKAFEGELTKEWREKQTNLPSADDLLEQIKEERKKHYEKQLADWNANIKNWEINGKKSKKPSKPKLFKELVTLSNEELSELAILPDGWKWEKNENYLFEVKDGTHDTPKYQEKGIPFITQKNIKNNNVSFSDVKYISQNDHNNFYKRSNVEDGDIIIAMIGHGRGNCCIVNTDKIFSIKNVGLFKFFKSIQNNKYCLHYYQSTLGLNLALKKSKGGAQPFIGLTELRNWPIPICSLEEQHQIVSDIESRLSVCDKVEKDIADSLEKAQALRQSILKKAFEGKLLSAAEIKECKSDKEYEPASVLLERIREEKKKK